MNSQLPKRRTRGAAVVVGVALLLAVTVFQWGTGSYAQTGATVGELQIDDLSLTAPITASSLSVTSTPSAGGGGGGAAGKATFGPIVLQKTINASSPTLMTSVATGVHLQSAVVRVYRPGTTRTLVTYTLSDVVLNGLEQTDNTEKLTMSYRTIEMTAGGQTACFDTANNVTC